MGFMSGSNRPVVLSGSATKRCRGDFSRPYMTCALRGQRRLGGGIVLPTLLVALRTHNHPRRLLRDHPCRALVLPVIRVGMIEASTMLRLSMQCTRSLLERAGGDDHLPHRQAVSIRLLRGHAPVHFRHPSSSIAAELANPCSITRRPVISARWPTGTATTNTELFQRKCAFI